MDVAKDDALSKSVEVADIPCFEITDGPDPLFSAVSTIRGIGPKLAEAFGRLLGNGLRGPARRLDLLLHLPHGLLDHNLNDDPRTLVEGERATLDISIVAHRPPYQRRQPYRIDCLLGDEPLQLVFFQGRRNYLQDQLPVGKTRVISGTIGRYGKGKNQIWQVVHPEFVAIPKALSASEPQKGQWLQPVYPSTQGLTQRVLQTRIKTALDDLELHAALLPEWQDPSWIERQGWPSLTEALRQIHTPTQSDDILPTSKARARLAYDELLASQLTLSLTRRKTQERDGKARKGDGRLRRLVIDALPFTLTAAQEQAIIEINHDLAKPAKMLRLLQGDVGSGKTVVAALAMLQVIEAGSQAALMAPTDVLVRQHGNALYELLRPAGVTVALLTGRESGTSRRNLLKRLASGEIQAIIGTHALFQDDVAF